MSDRSTVQSIALDRLIAHPDNPNRMSSSNFAKLVRNIEQTGRYEPLIVRPYRKRHRASRIEHRAASIENRGRFQIINGYHRWQALRQLGYKRAEVIVWDVDDDQADLLLATLNRLVGCDELSRKISLLKKLSKKMNARELSKLIPQTPGQIKRLVNLRIPKAPAKIPSDKWAKPSVAGFANPLVFFVSDKQKNIIEEALGFAETQTGRRTGCTVIPSADCKAAEVEESVQTGRHPSSFRQAVEPFRGQVRTDPSAALGVARIERQEPRIEHRGSSLTRAEAKAETLTLIAQHFIDEQRTMNYER